MGKMRNVYKQINRFEKKAIKESGELLSTLQILGKLASEATGVELVADICNGEELEFREVAPDGVDNEKTCYKKEDLFKGYNFRKRG